MSVVIQQMCAGATQRLLVGDVPLNSAGRFEQVWEEVLGSPELFGEAIHVPLRPGAIWIPQVVGTRDFGVDMLLHGATDDDQAGFNDVWRELARMVWSPEKPLTIRREVLFGTGLETHECTATYRSGLRPDMMIDQARGGLGRVSLRFTNLDGYWYAIQPPTIATITAPGGTYTIPGDSRTRRMVLEFSGGTGLQVLENTTTGSLVQYNGDTTAESATLDVFAFTATRGPSKANVLTNVSHAGDTFWMTLDPGDNEFTLSGGGQVEIRAVAVYL